MTAIPSFAFQDLDAPLLDDKMDVASSPFRQANDIDIDLDSVRDPSVIGSVRDEMIDDPADLGLDLMQDPFDDTFADDDMFDDSNRNVPEHNELDYNMDGAIEEAQGDEDEDILYEDEEETEPVPPENHDPVDYPETQTQRGDQKPDVEDSLEQLDYQSNPQEEALPATNEPENPNNDGISTGGESGEQLEQLENLQEQPLDAFEEYLGEQGEEQQPQQEQTEQGHGLAEDLEHPEQSASGEQSLEHETESQHTQAIAEPESTAPAATEVSKDQHEASTNNQEGDNTNKTLHPVTIVYLDDEMSLFPPMLGDESSIYFLSDPSVASEPVDQLLAACRQILDGTLDHHDELVLDVPSLGLHICEDSKYAAQITLAQILDVYLHLCHNDASQEARPLYCYLNSRVSLATQYAYLASAGGEGKTYAEIAADHLDSPEPGSLDAETVDETEAKHDDSSQLQPDDQAHSVEGQEFGQDATDHVQEGQVLAVLDLETQTQKDVAAESAAQDDLLDTAFDMPAPDRDLSETLAGVEESEQVDFREEEYAESTEQEHAFVQNQAPEFAEGELDANLNVADQLDDDADDGSDSSHTVEGDLTEAALGSATAEIPGVDDAGLYAYNEQGEDLFQVDEDTLENQAEDEFLDNEELFAAHDENFEAHNQDIFVDAAAEEVSSTLQETTVEDVLQDTTAQPINGGLYVKGDLQSYAAADAIASGNLSPPMTPKETKQAKRKVEDDDDLLFLDLDTPDPKRRRPS